MAKKMEDLTKEERAMAKMAFKKNNKMDPALKKKIKRMLDNKSIKGRTELLNDLAGL